MSFLLNKLNLFSNQHWNVDKLEKVILILVQSLSELIEFIPMAEKEKEASTFLDRSFLMNYDQLEPVLFLMHHSQPSIRSYFSVFAHNYLSLLFKQEIPNSKEQKKVIVLFMIVFKFISIAFVSSRKRTINFRNSFNSCSI